MAYNIDIESCVNKVFFPLSLGAAGAGHFASLLSGSAGEISFVTSQDFSRRNCFKAGLPQLPIHGDKMDGERRGGGSWCTKPGDQGTVTGANCQSLRGGQPVLLHTRSLLKANQARNIFPTARLAFSMSQTEVCDLEKTSLGVGKMTKNWHGKFRYKDYICVDDKHDKVGGGMISMIRWGGDSWILVTRTWYTVLASNNKHDILIHCYFNVGPATQTMDKHLNDIGTTRYPELDGRLNIITGEKMLSIA